MTNFRTIRISLDHLSAELLAFPFVSHIALGKPVDELDLNVQGKTAKLWRVAEQYFVRHFPNLSLDELISQRNASWFDSDIPVESSSGSSVIRLDQLLSVNSHKWLKSVGSVAEPQLPVGSAVLDSADPAARRAWRWLMFSMPGDLMLAGLADGNQGPTRVNLLCPAVDALLRTDGYAETHLHMGAGFDFTTAWASAINAVAREKTSTSIGMAHDDFKSPGGDHQEGVDLAQWLVRAAIVRYALGRFLVRPSNTTRFKDFLNNFAERLDDLYAGRYRLPLASALRDLRDGKLRVLGSTTNARDSFAKYQLTYNAITKASTFPLPKNLDEVQHLDPLCRYYDVNGYEGPSVQLQFLWQGLEYLRQCPEDRWFAQLFWQVERVRGQLYRHCIQRPLTPGLMNFIRFYERKSPMISLVDHVELESSGMLGGIGHGLKSLEVRTSPKSDADKQSKQLDSFEGNVKKLKGRGGGNRLAPPKAKQGRLQADGWQEVEIGLVLHFLKFRGKPADDGQPCALDLGNNADPSQRNIGVNNGLRWRNFLRQQRASAQAIGKAIDRRPQLLFLLRGLDVCRDEHGVPCWITSPLFNIARQRIYKSMERFRHRQNIELPALRTTAHVGEDFVHLASGLRYMDEAIDHLQLQQGDRIGHGLALGVEPNAWAVECTRLAMPCEDRWFDLIWEREKHKQPGARFTNDRRTFVEAEIVRLAKQIFQSSRNQQDNDFEWSVDRATELVSWLYSANKLAEVGFGTARLARLRPTGLLRQLERYLTEPAVYRRCRNIEWVCVTNDRTAVVELQRLVRERYSTRGIAIEVNPVSNLLVGNLTDLQTHPLWRLAPGLGNDDQATLRITVGSDDPFPFATNLPEEYQFLYDSLILAGKSHADARSWLQMIQRSSLESRFTVQQSV